MDNSNINTKMQVWYLQNPASGTHNVVVTMAQPTSNVIPVAVSFTNAAGTGATSSVLSQGTSTSVGISSTRNNAIVDFLNDIIGSGANPTAASGQTLLVASTTSGGARQGASGYIIATSTGSVVEKYNLSSTTFWQQYEIEVAAATSTANATTTYVYDNNGNLTSFGNTTNTWNYRNQLTQSLKPTGSSTYMYDYLGQRVKLVENGATTIFPDMYYNVAVGGAATSTKHLFANGILIATVEKNPSTTAVRYILDDTLGGSNVITDTAGTIVETLDYYPYGAARMDNKIGSYGGEKRKFIGQEYDGGTQLSYLNARYYNGVQGQFISEDPVFLAIGSPKLNQLMNGHLGDILSDPQILNAYSYARDNPISREDPSGLLTASQAQIARQIINLLQQAINLIQQQITSASASGGGNHGGGGTPTIINVGSSGSVNNGYGGTYQQPFVQQQPQSTPSGVNIHQTYSVGPGGSTSAIASPSGNSISPNRHMQLAVAGALGTLAGILEGYGTLGEIDNSASTIATVLVVGNVIAPGAIDSAVGILEASFYSAKLGSDLLNRAADRLKQ